MMLQLVCGLCGAVQKSEKWAKLTMHTSDQINAATIADTPRQGGTFRNFYDNHTEFLCASKSTTAAKNIRGDESAGNDTPTKTKSPPFVTTKYSCAAPYAKLPDTSLLLDLWKQIYNGRQKYRRRWKCRKWYSDQNKITAIRDNYK